jgi:hypothetical protein
VANLVWRFQNIQDYIKWDKMRVGSCLGLTTVPACYLKHLVQNTFNYGVIISSYVITCHHMSSHVITCHRYHIPPSMPSGMCFLRFSATVGRLAKATLSSSAVHKRHNEWSTNNDSKGSDIRGPNFINSHKPPAN